MLPGSAADYLSHGGILAETIRIVHVLLAREATVDRLPEQRLKLLLGIQTGAGFVENF